MVVALSASACNERTKSREAGTAKWANRAARSLWILAIDMDGVGDAARLGARAMDVLET